MAWLVVTEEARSVVLCKRCIVERCHFLCSERKIVDVQIFFQMLWTRRLCGHSSTVGYQPL